MARPGQPATLRERAQARGPARAARQGPAPAAARRATGRSECRGPDRRPRPRGWVLQTGDQFVTLVPLDAPLEAEVNVPGDEAGFVHAGNAATVKFDTFPFVRYGKAEGTVCLRSAD